MAEKFVSKRNLDFILYEVFDTESLNAYPWYSDHSRDTFDMVIETAIKIGTDIMYPALREMDERPPEYRDGEVFVHPVVKEFMLEAGTGGWLTASMSYEHGGQQLPEMINYICRFIFSAANYSLSVYPLLTAGAAHLIYSFGSDDLKKTYLDRMFSGEWQGTMALTETEAGSSLSDITTTAIPEDAGYYKIRGQKVFISSGKHNMAGNTVHLMLARIKGAPAGVKGISLFVVPEKRLTGSGSLEDNDVTCAGIYHKLGYRGSPITQLVMGDNNDCRGYLLGDPGRGLSYMFQMMNEARIEVGLGAAAIATAAYYAALEYTTERPQGRNILEKDPEKPQIPIIGHPDVKRMLLFQKAVTEGSLCLAMQLAKYQDMEKVTEGEEKERYGLLLDLLTPVVKTYPAEMGILSVSQGIQCLGGYGYCEDFPLELHYRDSRIHPIHEGTTGIQGMDLLGRKVVMKNGRAFQLFLEETGKAVAEASEMEKLSRMAEDLSAALEDLKAVTGHLTGFALKGQVDLFLADATLYLELFGITAIAWQWLLQAIAAQKALEQGPDRKNINFYTGKISAARYFFSYELPKTTGLLQRLRNTDSLTVDMKTEHFID